MRRTPIERATPNLENLLAALREVREVGRFAYEADGSGAALLSEGEDAVAAADALLGGCPEVARFIGVVFLAREERLARARRARRRDAR